MASSEQPNFESVKERLAEIADAVDDEALSLDDALDLYEEAVALGLQASDLLETGVVIPEDDAGSEGGVDEPPADAATREAAAPAADQQPEPAVG